MPESNSIDWPPPHPPRPRRRRRFLLILAILAGIFFGGRTALSYYVDALWFGSLSYGDVFWKTLSLQWGIFAAFTAATFLILYGSFLALKRAHLPDLPSGHTIFIGGQPLKLPVERVLRLIALGVSLVIAAATGAGMMVEWPTLALFWYAPRTTGGVADPIFGKPLNFFLFALPAWQLIAGWLLTLAVITCILAAFFILITGGSRVLAGRLSRYVALPWRGLSIAFAFLLLILAMRVYIGRFERLLERPYDLRRCDLHGRARHARRDARRLRGARSRRGDRSRQRRAGATRTLAGRGDPSGRGLLYRRSSSRLVRQQLYRQTERTGSRAALHCPQHRPDAAGLRIEPGLAARVSRGDDRRRGRRRRTIRLRFRTSGCGIGAHSRTRCVRFRKSAPTTTSPTSISIDMTLTARLAR